MPLIATALVATAPTGIIITWVRAKAGFPTVPAEGEAKMTLWGTEYKLELSGDTAASNKAKFSEGNGNSDDPWCPQGQSVKS